MTQASKALQALAAVAVLVAAAALLNPSAERHRSQIQKTLAERSPLAGALGLGALAGVLAMAVRSIGFISKTVAEAIEDCNKGPVEAMRAVGANRFQVLMFGIVPQVLPVIIGNVIFEWDVNIRRSTIMGLVGAGGLGLALHRQMASYNYGGIATVIFVILLLIVFGELFSAWARGRIARAVA